MKKATLALCVLASVAYAAEPFELALWPGTAPGSEGSVLKEAFKDRPITDGTATRRDRSIAGVTKPMLSVYLPEKGRRSGVAVVVCPGGGFTHLAIDKEGHDIARWLNEHGIAGIVVKYRLPDPDVGLSVRNGSFIDVQRAIRVVRNKAKQWEIDSGRIGVMGFSAGGYLTALAGVHFDESSRPDFLVPIYPLVSLVLHSPRSPDRIARMLGPDAPPSLIEKYSPETQVTAETPPAFLVHANDDNLPSEHSVRFYRALKKAGVRAELHIYSKGGHGFGIRARNLPVSGWRVRWLEWMRGEGVLQ